MQIFIASPYLMKLFSSERVVRLKRPSFFLIWTVIALSLAFFNSSSVPLPNGAAAREDILVRYLWIILRDP